MKTNKIRMRRLVWALLAGTSALLLATALSLLLSHFQALAQPAAEVAALQVNKNVNTNVAAPGNTLIYTIRIQESGSPLTLWMTDTLPEEVTYVADSLQLLGPGNAGFSNGVITWTAASFGWNQTAVITFSAQISSEITYANVVNTAQVTGTGEPIEDSAETTVVAGVGNLDNSWTVKTVAPDTAEPGDVLTYTIQIYNDGDFIVPGAWLTDDLPAELTYVPNTLDVSPPLGSAGFADGVITWTHDVQISQLIQLHFSAQISPGSPYDNWITNTVEIVAPSQSFTRASGTYIRPDTYYRYFPIIFKRWPPIPYAPTLDNIDNTDENGDYTVSWSYNDDNPDVPDPTAYTLQEATNTDFTDAVNIYEGPNESHDVTNKDEGTYYYRVQGHNEHGPGEWSSVKSANVVSPDFFDNFSSSSSGWTTHKSRCCLSGCDSARQHLNYKYDLYYGGGWYHVNVPLDCRGGGNHGDTRHIYPVSFAPGVERSTSETCIGLKGRFEEWDPYWSFWGLVFAASEDMSTVYSLEVNNLGDWGIVKRTDYQYPGPNHPFENETRTNIVPYIGEQRWPAKAGFTSNTLMVRVTNKKVKLYINGEEVYSFSEEILSLKRVGIIGGNWEITPTQIGYDYFLVDEGCDDY
ncbi:MAG: hypothetical protein V3T90_01415 [Anaerolineae bacterium]